MLQLERLIWALFAGGVFNWSRRLFVETDGLVYIIRKSGKLASKLAILTSWGVQEEQSGHLCSFTGEVHLVIVAASKPARLLAGFTRPTRYLQSGCFLKNEIVTRKKQTRPLYLRYQKMPISIVPLPTEWTDSFFEVYFLFALSICKYVCSFDS